MSASIKNLSLFIPRVSENYSKEYITKKFTNFGNVNRVDLVLKQDNAGKAYKSVYIYFNYWHNSWTTGEIQRDLKSLGSWKMYDLCEYFDIDEEWTVLINNTEKHGKIANSVLEK